MSTRKKVKGPWETAADDLVDTAQSIGKAVVSRAEEVTADASAALSRAKTKVAATGNKARRKIKSTVKKTESRIEKATSQARKSVAKAIDDAGKKVLAVAQKAERSSSPDAGFNANADLLIRACTEVLAREHEDDALQALDDEPPAVPASLIHAARDSEK